MASIRIIGCFLFLAILATVLTWTETAEFLAEEIKNNADNKHDDEDFQVWDEVNKDRRTLKDLVDKKKDKDDKKDDKKEDDDKKDDKKKDDDKKDDKKDDDDDKKDKQHGKYDKKKKGGKKYRYGK